MSMDDLSVKQNLREARLAAGLSQIFVAEQLGINRSSFDKLERGSTRIFNKHFLPLAKMYGRSAEELLLGYLPSKDESESLRESRERSQALSKLVSEYEARMDEKTKRIAALEELIKSKDENIRLLTEIKARLEKELDRLVEV